MATISVTFMWDSKSVEGIVVLTDVDVDRILAAEKTYLGTENDQMTADRIAFDLTNELIGNTATIERNQVQVSTIRMVQPEGKPGIEEKPADA